MVVYSATCGCYHNPILRPIVNKRTGIAAAVLFMRIYGDQLTKTYTELEIFAQDVTQSRLTLVEIASWLETHAVLAGK
jgi:prophage maintenance system killer protein